MIDLWYWFVSLVCIAFISYGAWNVGEFAAKGYTSHLRDGVFFVALAFVIPLFLILEK